MSWPSVSARTKAWITEILTVADLDGQFDVIHDYVNDMMDGSTGHDHSGGTSEGPQIDLTAAVTEVLPETNGGTNQSTYTQGDVLYASATNTLSKLAAGTKGQALTTGGSAANPVYAGMTTQGDIEYHNGTTRTALGTGTVGQVLQSGGASANPSWTSLIGSPVSKIKDTVYQAASAGFLVFSGDVDNGDDFRILTDSANPPTTVLAKVATSSGTTAFTGSMTVPIKRLDYYKLSVVSGTLTSPILYFIPIGG